jgi:hypothetical protein
MAVLDLPSDDGRRALEDPLTALGEVTDLIVLILEAEKPVRSRYGKRRFSSRR